MVEQQQVGLLDNTSSRRDTTLTLAPNDSPSGNNSSTIPRSWRYVSSKCHDISDLISRQASNPSLPKSIPALVSDAIRACDVELRQVIMGNVVLTGGGSLFTGFAERLNNELGRHFPHVRHKRLSFR